MSSQELREGPRLKVVASCHGCQYVRSKYYAVQNDSGYKVECVHPAGWGRIGDTTWDTPEWCPFMTSAQEELATALREAR